MCILVFVSGTMQQINEKLRLVSGKTCHDSSKSAFEKQREQMIPLWNGMFILDCRF